MRFIRYIGEETTAMAGLREVVRYFHLQKHKPVRRKYRSWETFDLDLARQGLLLKSTDKAWLLEALDGKPLVQVESKVGRDWTVFPVERLPRDLAALIKPLTGVRALLEGFSWQSNLSPYTCLDDDGKTVVRLWVEAWDSKAFSQPFSLLHVEGLLGYEKESETILALFEEAERGPGEPWSVVWEGLFRRLSRFPGHAGKQVHSVGATAGDAVFSILKHCTEVMRQNETGMLEDWDIEFLHDYRVAVRKVRAVLTLCSKVFRGPEAKRWKKDFARLGKVTNGLRDRDIALLDAGQYPEFLPEVLRPGLKHYTEALREQRSAELVRVQKYFKSADYQKLLKAWHAFLQKGPKGKMMAPASSQPVDRFAKRLLRKYWAKTLHMGRQIGRASPDAAMHDLRIEFKKIRYLVEFYQDALNGPDLDKLLRRLRQLQTVLGDLQDNAVQTASLKTFLGSLSDQNKKTGMLAAAAMGALLQHMESRHQEIRNAFFETFADLDKPSVRRLAESVWGKPKKQRMTT